MSRRRKQTELVEDCRGKCSSRLVELLRLTLDVAKQLPLAVYDGFGSNGVPFSG